MILHETFANVSSSSVNTNLSKQFISLRQQIIKIIVLVYIFSPRLTGISPTLSITLKTYLIQSLTTLNKLGAFHIILSSLPFYFTNPLTYSFSTAKQIIQFDFAICEILRLGAH